MEEAEWRVLEAQLASIIPVYEKMNKAMSLGTIPAIRIHVARVASKAPQGPLLDAGSGPGHMAEAVRALDPSREIVLLDPLKPMLREAWHRLGRSPSIHLVQGVMEHMPFRGSSFSGVITAFSLRDTMDMRGSLEEIHRVLRPGGAYILVDLARPGNRLVEAAMEFYLRVIVPLMASLVAPRLRGMYSGLHRTYRSMPPTKAILSWLRRLFACVLHREMMMGTVVITAACRARLR